MTEYTTTIPTQSYRIEPVVEQATLRDQFAMAALTGLLAANNASRIAVHEAYRIADAMLEARKEKK